MLIQESEADRSATAGRVQAAVNDRDHRENGSADRKSHGNMAEMMPRVILQRHGVKAADPADGKSVLDGIEALIAQKRR
ncbi:hypothetical protein NM208_g10694 [Fusarium decemcellulare]|uniref:Uncharacterized protein n=1 Tax=Fusarium decemcellulare TaxID=57161 RepID=A0ACC1RWZ2_9HYPO|nr:hypothetical protein NM208_g10694 [Fusarium decemcellulare]